MADLKISALNSLAGADLVAADVVAVVDDSASETKKLTVSDLIANGVTLISNSTIPSAKILFSAGSIATASVVDAAVTTAKVADSAITAAKLADNSSVTLVSTLPASGDFTGQIALDTDDDKIYIWDGSAWDSVKAAGSINVVNGSTSGIVNITTSTSGDTVTVSTTLDDTSAAANFLAGPTGAGGTVGYRAIAGSDLPKATTSTKGAVVVNGNGLTMSNDEIQINNSVTAETTNHHVVQYDANGLITAGRQITGADIPSATSSVKGSVFPGTGLAVTAAGELNHSNNITGGTFTKVTVDTEGHVTATTDLVASDIPDLPASKITTGTLPTERLANDAVTSDKLANESTTKFIGAGATDNVVTFPDGDFKGQFAYDEKNEDLYVYTGNSFIPITVISGNLVNAGTYNASTNLISSVTTAGSAAGFTSGGSLPTPATTNLNYYVVVDTSGTGSGAAPAVALAPPDMLVSLGTGATFQLVDVSNAIAGQTAANISVVPVGSIAATDAQAAIQELDTEKLAKAGGTMTGNLELGDGIVIVFEGATANDYETTLTVADPTADRTITLPDETGTVLTTGASGAVTSAMIADGTIVNADISASAEIAVSKLANGTARQLLQTDSTGADVEFTSNIDVPGTLDCTGAGTFDSTLTVTGVINADGKVKFPAGTAALPSFYNGTDTDTGLFFSAANEISVSTGGTQRVVIDSSGNVGIGVSSAAAGLHIDNPDNGAITQILDTDNAAVKIVFRNSTETGNNVQIGADGSSLVFVTNGTESGQFDSSSRLLVNGTSASGDNKLQVIDSDASIYGVTVGRGKNGVSSNTAVGSSALFTNTTGSANTGVGLNALYYVTTGSNNTGVGNRSLQQTTGSNNTGVGSNALHTNNAGSDNTAVGYLSLYYNTTGNNNTAVGRYALVNNTTGSKNIGIGYTAGDGITTGSNNTIIGDIAGTSTLSDTVIIGAGSTERLRIDSSGRVLSGTSSSSANVRAVFQGNSAGATGAGIVQIARGNTFTADDTNIGNLEFTDSSSNVFGRIQCESDGTVAAGSDHPGRITFETTADGASTPTERMRIDSSGNLGLGVASPQTRFHSVGTTNGAQATFGTASSGLKISTFQKTNNDAGVTLDAQHSSNGTLRFATTGTERFRIDASGNVGIGTTSADRLLHLAGADTAIIRLENSDSSLTADQIIGGLEFEKTDGSGAGAGVVGGLRMYSEGSIGESAYLTLSTASNTANDAEALRIDSSGRVLVGTTTARANFFNSSASAALQVEGSGDAGRISVFRSDSCGTLILGYTSTPANGNAIGCLSYQGYDGSEFVEAASVRCDIDGTPGSNDMPGRLVFSTTADGASSNTERMRIDSSGNVGIGTTSVNEKLRVEGNIRLGANNSIKSNSSGGTLQLQGGATYAGGNILLGGGEGNNDIRFRTTGASSTHTERMRIASNGVVTVKNGAVAEIDALTDAATITPDLAASCNFSVTLGGNRTLANPSNITAGQSGSIFVTQDGTGSRTLAFGSYWDFAGGTAPTLTTTASAVDRIDYIVRSSTSIHAVATLAYS